MGWLTKPRESKEIETEYDLKATTDNNDNNTTEGAVEGAGVT